MNTENPIVSSFEGLEGFQKLVEGVHLLVSDGSQTYTLVAGDNSLNELDQRAIPKLGLRLNLNFDFDALQKAASLGNLEDVEISLVVMAEDPFLKERDCLFFGTFPDVSGEIVLSSRGSSRPRSLQNSREGLRIEVLLVLATPIEPLPGRPFRVGAKLASQSFRITTYPETAGLPPVELTDEVRREHGLSKKSLIFVEPVEELLGSESLAESVIIHIDGRVLEALRAARSGPAYQFVATGLAISAIQQIVYLLSVELNSEPDFEWGVGNEAVLSFIHSKLLEVKRIGKEKPSREDSVALLRDRPHVAASLMTGLLDYTSDARKLLDGPDEEG